MGLLPYGFIRHISQVAILGYKLYLSRTYGMVICIIGFDDTWNSWNPLLGPKWPRWPAERCFCSFWINLAQFLKECSNAQKVLQQAIEQLFLLRTKVQECYFIFSSQGSNPPPLLTTFLMVLRPTQFLRFWSENRSVATVSGGFCQFHFPVFFFRFRILWKQINFSLKFRARCNSFIFQKRIL